MNCTYIVCAEAGKYGSIQPKPQPCRRCAWTLATLLRSWRGSSRQRIVIILAWLVLLLPPIAQAAPKADSAFDNTTHSATRCGIPIDAGLLNQLNQKLLYTELVYSKDRADEASSAATTELVEQPAREVIIATAPRGRRFFWFDW